MQRSDEGARATDQAHRRWRTGEATHALWHLLCRTLDHQVAVLELHKALQAQCLDKLVELRLQLWPKPTGPQIEAVQRGRARADLRRAGVHRQDATTQHIARFEQHDLAHALLCELPSRDQPGQTSTDDGDAGVGPGHGVVPAK